MIPKMGVLPILLAITLIVQSSLTLSSTQDATRIKRHADGGQQQSAFNNQRQTQFVTSPQTNSLARHSLGPILPANNHVLVSRFQQQPSLISHPSTRYLQPTSSALLLSEFTQQQQQPSQVRGLAPIQTNSSNNFNQMETANRMRNDFLQANMEQALRHATGDENVFQPVPIIGPHEHNYEWPTHTDSPTNAAGLQQSATTFDDRRQFSQSPSHQTTTTTTTEQSNNIAQNEVPVVVTMSQIDSHESTSYLPPPSSVSSSSNLNSSSIDLNNHVIYEGPATAPPTGDYFFSSSEKLPNNERASNAWWAIGTGHEFERASNLTRDDYLDYCSKSEFLISNKQRSLCRSHPKVMPIVARGLRMAIDECQTRFTSNRWNCSLVLDNSLAEQQASRMQVFGDVMKQPNRERSFLNAIFAASLAHTMTRACSQGELPEECSCDKRIRSKNNKGKIEWVACSDDIDYGARFSRDFTDNTDSDSDTTSMINIHNYEVGRRVFKSSTDITCTCMNGENGLCQTKRCWKHLGPFADIGEELMKRYEGATHVQLSNKDPHKLRPVRRGVRKPKRKDLVYIDESPDYCNAQTRIGVLGTQNRRCNSTSLGSDSCSLLCCGRGYQVVIEEVEEDCNCKFVWCCQVKCDRCKRQATIDVCN